MVVTGLPLLLAQPPNDECLSATQIADPREYCSDVRGFTNINATPSAQVRPTCFPGISQDVWFTFVATASELNVRVIGSAGVLPGGTLRNPEVAVYDGNCTQGLVQQGCLSDAFGNHIVELLVNNLVPARRYYIRVNARNSNQGTFQLCVSNFTAVPDPSSDCATGVVLCDKSPFSVQSLSGSGVDVNEVGGTCVQQEFASAWYKWTCDQPGSLTFTLTPNNPSDDLDFVVYELPNGVDNCSGKIMLRCMASGENVGAPLEQWIRCYGPTGLREGSTDIIETPGCQPGDDNFLAPLQMEAGKSYALIVNNFSNTGNGFSVSFGGRGTFLGPHAAFDIQGEDTRYCRNDSLLVIDQSEANGSPIIGRNWNFGEGGPLPRTGEGPHRVFYPQPGYKTISLTVENERGCLVTTSQTILIECCDYPVVVDAGGDLTVDLGEPIRLNVFVDLPGFSYTYLWTPPEDLDCSDCPDPTALIGNNTQFTVLVTDEEGCIGLDSITIWVNKIKPVFIPTAFTPDGNGVNDRFTVFTGRAATRVKVLRIYSRWGELVYEGFDFPPNDTAYGWDGQFRGQPASPGVYVYYAEVAFLDDEQSSFAGDLTLIR